MALRGRPRTFDRADALRQVMSVFWTKGYEGAQINDLIAAIGISPPSFYAAFGSKEAAFREAVDLYVETVGSGTERVLDGAPNTKEAIRAALADSIDASLSSKSGGCLLILGAVNYLPENEAAWSYLVVARRATLSHLHKRLERGVKEGDISADTNVQVLASFFYGVMQAISFQARDGAKREDLEALIPPALAALN